MDDQPKIPKAMLYRAAVGRRKDNYYVSKFLAIEQGDTSRRSWNWAALLFAVFWLVYRRMYLSALIVEILGPPSHDSAVPYTLP